VYRNERGSGTDPAGVVIRLILLTAGILAGFIVMKILFASIVVPDTSMEPALRKGDKPVFLKLQVPARGEIVLIDSPIEQGKSLVSRVVAVEGDTVEMKDSVFYLNGKPGLAELKVTRKDGRVFPLYFSNRDNMPPVRIGRNEFFLLNDNRDIGFDGRYYGKTGKDSIKGVFFRNRKK